MFEWPSSPAWLEEAASSSMSASASSTSVGGRSSHPAPQRPAAPRKCTLPAMAAPIAQRQAHVSAPGTAASSQREKVVPRQSHLEDCATSAKMKLEPNIVTPNTRSVCGDLMRTQMTARALEALLIISDGSQLISTLATPGEVCWFLPGSVCSSRSQTCLLCVASSKNLWSSARLARPRTVSSFAGSWSITTTWRTRLSTFLLTANQNSSRHCGLSVLGLTLVRRWGDCCWLYRSRRYTSM
mmetsp:Transcript_59863/g.174968  ORF Transcript_59863/g.174968 Transcript_59863/m.174968 type:complete len:241 (-) Transcript_59863:322-1044(-)